MDGWVRIRLADDAGALRVGCFTRGAAESGNRAIDEAAARLGATEIRRVFAEGAGSLNGGGGSACICGTISG